VLPDLAVEPGETLRLSGLTFRFPEQPELSTGLVIEIVGEQVVFGADLPATAGEVPGTAATGIRYVVPPRGAIVDRAQTAASGRPAARIGPAVRTSL
jgi:hypothetical protein